MTRLFLMIEEFQKLLMMTLLELLSRNVLPVRYECLCDLFEWLFKLSARSLWIIHTVGYTHSHHLSAFIEETGGFPSWVWI
jgi:hypothetical protein